MFGIGRYIKKDLVDTFLGFFKKNFFKSIYPVLLFLTSKRNFKKAINRKKLFIKYDANIDSINKHEYKFTSQNNEDGIIEHIFSLVDNSKTFVEIGFEFTENNSLHLIKQGWKGLLIDSNFDTCLKMKKCLDYFYPHHEVKVINEKVNKDNINKLIFDNIKEQHVDFFSIDIDGNDYWILQNLNLKVFNVVCCEYNPFFGNTHKRTIPYDVNFAYKGDYYFGASLNTYADLLKKNSFDLIAVDSSGTNAFFVNNQYSKIFDVLEPSYSFKKSGRHSDQEISEISSELFNKYKLINL